MAYIGNTPDIDAQVLKYEYTATAGQTVFNCSYDNTVDVHINGVLLAAADYTATTGTDITLVVGATVSDEVQINGYKKFFSADHYDKTASDARFLSPTGDGSGLSGINTDLVSDTTPQLGGSLDLNGNAITGTGAIPSANLTGALPAIDGSALTGLASVNQAQVQTHLITSSSQAIGTANIHNNITGLSATITPTTASKRIKVTVRWQGEWSLANNDDLIFGIKRGSVQIGQPSDDGVRNSGIAGISQGYYNTDASSTMDSTTYSYIDSPATAAATTYYATVSNDATGTLYNQRVAVDSNATYIERLTSSITLEEID